MDISYLGSRKHLEFSECTIEARTYLGPAHLLEYPNKNYDILISPTVGITILSFTDVRVFLRDYESTRPQKISFRNKINVEFLTAVIDNRFAGLESENIGVDVLVDLFSEF